MDEKRKLRVIERINESLEETLDETIKDEVEVPKISHPNQTNPLKAPIYKNLAKFVNAKIGDKWSIKDLLR